MDFINLISEVFSNAGYIGNNSKKNKFWLFEVISILLLISGVVIIAIKLPSVEIKTISTVTIVVSIFLALLVSILAFVILVKSSIIKQVTLMQLIGYIFSWTFFLESMILLIWV
ncbi:MAG: hypothetical protein R2753_10120 [Chitinophagales bacterium]